MAAPEKPDYARRSALAAIDSLKQRRRHFVGPNLRKPRPNERTQRVAGRLLAMATDITRVTLELDDELASVGYARGSDGSAISTGSGSPTEANAARARRLVDVRAELRETLRRVESDVDSLGRIVRSVVGSPATRLDSVPLCSDRQIGREGVDEWGDAYCSELPVTRGLCARCYGRERKWRRDLGLPGREEPA